MKRKVILCTLLALLVLTGCTPAAVNPADTCPGHTPASVGWNDREHWDACACGEKMNVQSHDLDPRNICRSCGVEVVFHDDAGVVFVSTYDEQGNLVIEHRYENGFMYAENGFAYNSDGEHVRVKSHYYFNSGEKEVGEFDEHGNEVYSSFVDANGKVISESWNEYSQDADGNLYMCRSHEIGYDPDYEIWTEYAPTFYGGPLLLVRYTHVYGDGRKFYEEYDKNGAIILDEEYDAKGNLISSASWGYDDDGNELWQKEYHNGVLVREITDYLEWIDVNGIVFRRPEFEISYQDDGTRLVTYYTYFDDGFEKSESVYDGDRLVLEKKYEAVPYTWPYLATETEYHADDTKTVIEYNEYEEVISEITYDANGNVIE